ncbi:MAG: hypothetical protein D6692_10800, partial [Planctomycetota bacterium]
AGRGAQDGTAHWDFAGGSELDYSYSLFADPNADGSVLIPVDLLPAQPSVSSLIAMADNAWSDFTVATSPVAATASGNFLYRLRVEAPATGTAGTINVFKIRTSGVVTVERADQPLSYMGMGLNDADFPLLFPNFPNSAIPSAYDGIWSFFFDVPTSQSVLEVWDGDFDRGKFDGTEQDTDDPNTPNSLPLPFTITPDVCPEGVATDSGTCGATGSLTGFPPDDAEAPGTFSIFVRTPSIHYDLIFPDGQVFSNENPSGNREWELFRLSTAPVLDPAVDDFVTPSIPAGVYELRAQGVDLFNLNALRLPRLVCVDEAGNPCTLLRPFLVGDTVFEDGNGNGLQDGGEAGIAGVAVNLLDGDGNLIATTSSDGAGLYRFEVEAGDYFVEIDASNFASGGALEGFTSTTGGEVQASVVAGANDLERDFGYAGAAGSIGDLVWFDRDGDGVQDPGEPGIPEVVVQLFDGSGALVASTTTDAAGLYGFGDLSLGAYRVAVDPATLPSCCVCDGDSDSADSDSADSDSADSDSGMYGKRKGNKTGDSDSGKGDSDSGKGDSDSGDSDSADSDSRDSDRITFCRLSPEDGDSDSADSDSADSDSADSGDSDSGDSDSGDSDSGDSDSGDSDSDSGAGDSDSDQDGTTCRLAGGRVLSPTFDLDGVATPHRAALTLAADAAERTDVDFGYRCTAERRSKSSP